MQAWRGLNRLIRETDQNSAQVNYVHDIWGNVIAESDGSGPTGTVREYIYLPEAEIAPTFGSRATVDRPIGVVEGVNTASPVLWFVHVDHLNRPVKMTDAAKAAVWDAVFLPWGGVHAITGSATLDARFPGQWFQLESGLHYNWHRQYDPSIGRYIQPDPLGFVDGPSVYGYVGGQPQASIDLDGLTRLRPRGRPATMNFPRGEGTPRPSSSNPTQCTPLNPTGTPQGGVYVFIDPSNGRVVYVGGTNNFDRRRGEHGRDSRFEGMQFDPRYPTNDYATRRGVENDVYNSNSGLINTNRPVSPSNRNIDSYNAAAQTYWQNR